MKSQKPIRQALIDKRTSDILDRANRTQKLVLDFIDFLGYLAYYHDRSDTYTFHLKDNDPKVIYRKILREKFTVKDKPMPHL